MQINKVLHGHLRIHVDLHVRTCNNQTLENELVHAQDMHVHSENRERDYSILLLHNIQSNQTKSGRGPRLPSFVVHRTINGRTDSMHIHLKSLCTLNGPLVGLNYTLLKLSCHRRVKR